MKTLVVLDENCGNEAAEYQEWLSKNLPDDIRLDWQEQASGASGGLFDEQENEIDNPYWEMYCDS